MTKSQEMRAKLSTMKGECQAFLDGGKAAEARAKMDEIREMNDMIDMQEELEAEEKENFRDSAAGRMQEARQRDAVAEFADAARNYFKNAMTEGTNKDGGYTVPEDISTQVKNYREEFFDMTQYVNVEKVSTKSGARTYQKKKTVTGFQVVGEGTAIPGLAQPEFERIAFTIAKYAGIIPVTRELLSDSDANIVRIIMRWFGRNSAVTRNNLIFNIIKAKTQVSIGSMNDIRTALNVTLGSVYKPTSKIFLNDDGLNYIDGLVDGQGRPLLNPDPTAPAQLRFRVGTNVIPIVNVPNAFLPTVEGVAPIIIGDLKEGITLFDREQLSMSRSDEASVTGFNAFAQDGTLFRGIERLDVEEVDGDAYVYGGIDLSKATEYGSGHSAFLGGALIASGSGGEGGGD